MHEPRGKVGVGIGFAVSETGADHLVSYHDTAFTNPDSVGARGALPLGIKPGLPARELSPQKVANYAIGENWSSAEKVLGLCYFGPVPRSFIQVEDALAAIEAATGWGLTVADVLRIGERATNLARAFNAREGFGRQDDRLPERLFEPLEGGALTGAAISPAEFEAALTELYRLKGWDPVRAAPTRGQLAALEIEWVADLLDAA